MASVVKNPWQYMEPDTARRVDLETPYDFFWICNQEGKFGLLIHFLCVVKGGSFLGQMKGMSVISLDEGGTKFYIVLHDNKEWEMFFAVCNDLMAYGTRCANEEDMVKSINQRLKRWKKFLSEDNELAMSERVQMGLFAEMNCLKNLIPIIGYQDAIMGWVGPDADQKDFSFEKFFIEVKSFKSSKGNSIVVSSLGQLDDEIKPVYLLAYALSDSESGESIPTLSDEIYKLIPLGDVQMRSLFDAKLGAYGYFPDITIPPFSKYNVDAIHSYLVENDFPRITSFMVDKRISKVSYNIDLSNCDKFKQSLSF